MMRLMPDMWIKEVQRLITRFWRLFFTTWWPDPPFQTCASIQAQVVLKLCISDPAAVPYMYHRMKALRRAKLCTCGIAIIIWSENQGCQVHRNLPGSDNIRSNTYLDLQSFRVLYFLYASYFMCFETVHFGPGASVFHI